MSKLSTDIIADIGWAINLLKFSNKPTRSDLIGIISEISEMIKTHKINSLEIALIMLMQDPKLRLDIMIIVLRGSYPAHLQINRWDELIFTARQRIIALGREPDSLLQGLY